MTSTTKVAPAVLLLIYWQFYDHPPTLNFLYIKYFKCTNWKSGFQHRWGIDGFKMCKKPIYVSTRKTLILPKIGRQKTEGDKSLHGHGPAPEHLLAKLG